MDNGEVYSQAGCIFRYCPHPETCKKHGGEMGCVNPNPNESGEQQAPTETTESQFVLRKPHQKTRLLVMHREVEDHCYHIIVSGHLKLQERLCIIIREDATGGFEVEENGVDHRRIKERFGIELAE